MTKLTNIEKFKSIKAGDVIYNKAGFKMTVTSAKEEDGVFTVRIKEDTKVWFQLDEQTGRFESQGYYAYEGIGANFTKAQKFSDLQVGQKVKLSNGKTHKVVGLHFDQVKLDVKHKFGLLTMSAVPFSRKGKGPRGLTIVEVL